jgi:hypothetical protein
MKKTIAALLVIVALLFVPLAVADEIRCPEHAWATCHDTYESKTADDGGTLHKFSCTCGDEWWVRVD